MPELDTANLERMFKLSENSGKQLYYAFGQGASFGESHFVVHKTMKGKALAATMGEPKDYKKIGFGTLKVANTTVTIVQQKANGKIESWLPKMLKKASVRYDVALGAPGGAEPGGESPEDLKKEQEMTKKFEAIENEIDALLGQI